MSERNKLTVSSITGQHILLINSFEIVIDAHGDDVVYSVYRKDDLVYSPDTLQEAVKWCED